MKGLKRVFKDIIGYLQNQKGYTLSEMTAVIAVTATLTALAIPVVADKVQQGKLARAAMDVNGLNQALASFQRSMSYWPGDTTNPSDPGLGGVDIQVLFVGRDGMDPRKGGANWPTGGDDASKHLVTNSVSGTVGADDPIYLSCTEDIKSNCWAGPYIGGMKEDPWGNRFLINIQAFYDKTDTAGLGWLISAGPDGVINTDVTDAELDGDDIGVMAYKARFESQ